MACDECYHAHQHHAADWHRCACHGEPMYWCRDKRYEARGFWRCAIRICEQHRQMYDRLDGLSYARMLLRHRRDKGLARMRVRHSQPEVTSG